MIEVRPFASLGHADHGWLNARHHFSFANDHDPSRMGWGALRVWNDDEIGAHTGFPPHPHRDMEIITFIRSGAISHEDSQGNKGRTGAGDVQVMSAGNGIVHAEYNREAETTTLFQIWIIPDAQGGTPGWGQREFPRGARAGKWEIVASGNADADGALPIRADARVLAATLLAGGTLTYAADPDRHLYLVAATGSIMVNGVAAQARDGVAITGESDLTISATADAEIVMVDSR